MKRVAILTLTLASFTASITACKKSEQASDGTKSTAAKPTEQAAPADDGPFAGWDMAARRAAFQGAHVLPGSALGAWEAWNVAGDKVTIWNGTAEKTLELAVLSPCEVEVTERGADGSRSSTIGHYTLKDGQLVQGLGDAGARRGGEAIACVSNKLVTLDAKGTCTEWSRSMFRDGKYEQKPGTCGFRKEGDKEVFAVTLRGHESLLEVHGDALLSSQLAATHSEKAADFAAAKAARDAK